MEAVLVVAILGLGLTTSAAVIVYLWYENFNVIGNVRMPEVTARAVVGALELPPKAEVVDLGAGDGGVLRMVKKAYPDARVIGYENNLVLAVGQWLRPRGVEWRRQDLMTADVRAAAAVIVYLHPALNARVAKKLKLELSPGAQVVSVQFRLLGLELVREFEVEGAPEHAKRIFVYRA